MKTSLVRPCKNCPFRTDCTPAWLGRARAADIAESLLAEASFSCHETNGFDDEGETIETSESQHCAGAMILLEHLKRPNQWMRWMERLGFYDQAKMDMTAPVFTTVDDFVRHHDNRRNP